MVECNNSQSSTMRKFVTIFYYLLQNLVVADAGDYSCVAKNKFGEVSGSGRLIIRRESWNLNVIL